MKCLGTNGSDVIVQLNYAEWCALGGKSSTSGYVRHPDTTNIPDVKQMVDALRKIENAHPDLERIRASFKTFLMLTEPEAISEVLKACGVAEPVETIEEADLEE